MNYQRKRDTNEMPIVNALRAAGAAVQRVDGVGVPDLVVEYKGVMLWMEVKMPLGPRGGLPQHRASAGGEGDLTAQQVKWWTAWKGRAPVIVRSVDEALAVIKRIDPAW